MGGHAVRADLRPWLLMTAILGRGVPARSARRRIGLNALLFALPVLYILAFVVVAHTGQQDIPNAMFAVPLILAIDIPLVLRAARKEPDRWVSRLMIFAAGV